MKKNQAPTVQQTEQKAEKPGVFQYGNVADDIAWVEKLDRQASESEAYWDKEYKLNSKAKSNDNLYLGRQALDKAEDGGTQNLDNRIFSSVRTIVPYVTSRITQPEIYPSSNAVAARKFAEDFEKAIYVHAEKQKVRHKLKYSLEDAIIRMRGYLKPRYDAVTKNFCAIEYVPAENIIVDHRAIYHEEPRFFRHKLEKPIKDLLVMFPDMADKLRVACGIDKNNSEQKLEECIGVNEDWCFIADDQEGLDLIVTWSYKKLLLGKTQDPNWRYGDTNFLDHHMMPLVFLNVLNDGRKYIDRTSFVEQASLLQQNVDERSNQISSNAGLGTTGMPVVDAAALADDQSEYLSFDEDTVLVLDVENANGKSINDVFTVWKAGTMPNFVYEDKIDSRNSIDNTFGTPNVFRGEQSKNNTLGQDVLVRDQAFGRQQEIIDAIDSATERLYMLIAQFLLVYGDEEELFKFVGENGQFDYILIHSDDLDTNILISVKSGTSMPIDRAQRRKVADQAASYSMIDPLTYWEIMDESNAEKYAKRLVDYTSDPGKFMKDIDDQIFNRDAFVDIELIKHGTQPPFRKDLPKEYFDYMNHYVLSGNLDDPALDPTAKEATQQFIDAQLARGQKMLGMAETQLPTPEEVVAANKQTDELNQQDMAMAQQQAKASPSVSTAAPELGTK